MALDAVEQLLLLGCNADDVQSLVRDKTTKNIPHPEWYVTKVTRNHKCFTKGLCCFTFIQTLVHLILIGTTAAFLVRQQWQQETTRPV